MPTVNNLPYSMKNLLLSILLLGIFVIPGHKKSTTQRNRFHTVLEKGCWNTTNIT